MANKIEHETHAKSDHRLMLRILPYFLIFTGCLVLFLPLLLLRADRVGDGSEYYALYIAFTETLRPWMSTAAFSGYNGLFLSGTINGLVPVDVLVNSFPVLKLGATADFNHFWLYSALAAIVATPFSNLGDGLPPHSAFLLLHAILMAVTAMTAYRFYGKTGVIAVLVMTLTSPLVWFTNKVHTEFYTYSLGLTAIIFLFSKKYAFSAFALALVSAQNPSFGLVALIVLAVRVIFEFRKPYDFFELIAVVLTVLVVLLHPVYYFSRFGVLSPQFLAGGASLGGNASQFYIWLFDPDLGLFTNWPIGLVFLVLGLALILRSPKDTSSEDKGLSFGSMGWWLCLVYLLVGLYANSSTLNLNSGATLGVARYALWYIPLLFPFFVVVLRWLADKRVRRYVGVVGLLIAVIYSLLLYRPNRSESYTTPSILSRFLQTNASWVYDPPSEVFLERYSGFGEGEMSTQLFAVVGPDCKKVLLLQGDGRDKIAIPEYCLYEKKELRNLLLKKRTKIPNGYTYLSKSDINQLALKVEMNKYYSLATGGDGTFILDDGWSGEEDWGVWSDDAKAILRIPCNTNSKSDKVKRITLKLVGFSASGHPVTKLTVKINQIDVWKGEATSSPNDIEIAIPQGVCLGEVVPITIDIQNPVSPKDLGLSDDTRNLGIGLLGFKLN